MEMPTDRKRSSRPTYAEVMFQCGTKRSKSHRVPGKLENSENPHEPEDWTTLPMFSMSSLSSLLGAPANGYKRNDGHEVNYVQRVLPELLLTGSGNQHRMGQPPPVNQAMHATSTPLQHRVIHVPILVLEF